MTAFETRSVLCASAVGFHRMVYSVWGAAQAARTVLCVHGLTRNGRDFDYLAERLAADGLRVICPDIVGRGRSDRLPAGAVYGIPQYVADLTVLLAAERVDRVAWFGTSMGGMIGMVMAAMEKSPLETLMINDVGPFIPKAALERIGDYVGVDWRFDSFEEGREHVMKAYAPFGLTREEEWTELARNSLTETTDPETGRRVWTNNYDIRIAEPFEGADITDIEMWPVWDAIHCPVQVLRGAQSDLLLAETARDMAARGPGARVIEIPGCGHAPALMDEGQVAIVRNWLAATGQGGA